MGQTITSIRRADVVIIVMEVKSLFEIQDLKIAQLCITEGKGVVVVVNKIDLVDDKKELKRYVFEIIKTKLNSLVLPVVIFTSALSHKEKFDVMYHVQKVASFRKMTFPSSFLNKKIVPYLTEIN